MLKMIHIWFQLRSSTVVCIVTIFGLSNFAFCQKTEVSPEKSIVWGPGLDPRVVVPVRYFYIQAVDSTGQNFTTSPGKDAFMVQITSASGKEHIRIHVPLPLDREDGSFLVRYRLYTTPSSDLSVQVLHKNKPVAKSPYILTGPVYHEYCACPEEDAGDWQAALDCPAGDPQVEADFETFPFIDLARLSQEVPRRFAQRGGLIHYTILNNQLHRRTQGKYTDFKMFSDEMLLSVMRKVRLPDVEFYMNVGDWPMEKRNMGESPGPVPVISWCGSTDTRDIILPTYDITHSSLETMRGVTNDLLSIQGHTGPVWSNKTEKAFFRGRDSREERLHLVTLSKDNPQLLDAGITAYFFFRQQEKELGKAPLIGFFDFFNYKYQVNVDGTVAAYRFPYLMLGNSLVLKQKSPYYEHFYTHMKPGKHYIPVDRNLADLIQKIKWAKDHDAEAESIAKEGQRLARELLQPHRLYCYYYLVLQTYASRQVGQPTVHPDMELVPQPSDHASLCSCQRGPQASGASPRKDEL
ncbi:protein O-glucosyltransferase 3 isoform X2 [Alosa pseudoharengus]|uniref:protein O-glucosyltransferase 3 isoform X2 n=1 Tax=Alosa pseudoharengus TaxID=34774 RepID=UPI003F88BF49